MNKKKTVRSVAIALSTMLGVGTLSVFAGCTRKTDMLVVMTEALNGLFNPFYSTTGTDMDVVGMTQLSMLSTNESGQVDYGVGKPTVVLDYKTEFDPTGGEKNEGSTTYYFVLKNGIKYSDGEPLTMNDVLFNMYVYLDPVYTGSSTMYSTDIIGLSEYRTQRKTSGSSSEEDAISVNARNRASDRIKELTQLYTDTSNKINGPNSSAEVSETQMREAIASKETFSDGYKRAISDKAATITVEDCRKQLLADYEFVLKTFKEELENDYESAKDSFTEEPYKSAPGGFDEITSFMYMEGYVTLVYEQTAGSTADKSKIKEVNRGYSGIASKEAAIKYVYEDKVATALSGILSYYGTANTVKTDYISKATDVILHENLKDGEMAFDHVRGITSMGHDATVSDSSVTIGSTTYKIAKEHNENGTVKNADEYDVLRIEINGKDPKAIWNFGFSVAPYHYYSYNASNQTENKCSEMDIANHKFGVEWGSYDFMRDTIQGRNKDGNSKNQVPVGAGPYSATDRDAKVNSPSGSQFYNSGLVFYKANEDFLLGAPNIKRLCYQVVSSTNALDMLKSGKVHYVTPQFTKANKDTLDTLKSKGFESVATWQLGYGYIGINAGKVEDINLRMAIMSAMDISRARQYYTAGTCVNIAYPMSLVSWAYPREEGVEFDATRPLSGMVTSNGKSYMQFTDDDAAMTKIREYMDLAKVSAGDSRLKIKFTIAGSNLTEHPVYSVFNHAATLLNKCGWTVDVVPDTNALTKLATGSLTVWAAAWGSTIDPDMYQVYHKNSTATSVLSWGYREILANPAKYSKENTILTELSKKIEAARKTDDITERTDMYFDAMNFVLDLAVEMPVYQRQELYAYNAKVIDKNTLPSDINSYSSPLGKIWELDFVK